MLWVAKLLPRTPALWKRCASTAAHHWLKLRDGSPECSALMDAEPNGGTPIRNWSTIGTDTKLSAVTVDRFSASAKRAPGNTAPTTATLQNASTEVKCNDAGTASGRNGISRIVSAVHLSLKRACNQRRGLRKNQDNIDQ